MEASLQREHEFNAASQRINADYLVNVLKRFLLTTAQETSERSKLASVICQILHLSSEDTKTIVEKWAMQPNSGGLVGWFQRPPPPPTMKSNNNNNNNSNTPLIVDYTAL